MTILLTQVDPTSWGERGRAKRKERKGEKKELERERGSTFSLDFPAIGSSNPDEARDKVDPHGKGYAWIPALGILFV